MNKLKNKFLTTKPSFLNSWYGMLTAQCICIPGKLVKDFKYVVFEK